MKLTNLIQSDIDNINSLAAWTDDQRNVFDMLIRDRHTDTGIMTELRISRNRYYDIKKQIETKANRIYKDHTKDRFF